MRSPIACVPLVALLSAAAATASAQTVQGRLLNAADSTPVPAALVRLVNQAGTRVAQTGTLADGVFVLRAPAPGRYVVAVLRVGQRPWRSAPLDVDSGVVRRVTLSVPIDPITLETVSVESRSACRTNPAEGSVIAALLQEADRALTVTRLAMERREGGYLLERYARTQTLLFRTVDSIGVFEAHSGWPIRSAPPESLALHGFVREDSPSAGRPYGGWTYFGPDADVLLSPWFLSTHCFSVSEGSGADSGTIVIAFRPEHARLSDLEGSLVLTRRPLELRRIVWRFVRLPWWVTREGAGGSMTLVRQPSGEFLPVTWWMRGPVPVSWVADRAADRRMGCWREEGGRTVPDLSRVVSASARTLEDSLRVSPALRCTPLAVATPPGRR